MILPRQPDHASAARTVKLSILKVMEFSSNTLRSGVVVTADDGAPGEGVLFLRGAPSVIRDLVRPTSVPHDFDQARSLLRRMMLHVSQTSMSCVVIC